VIGRLERLAPVLTERPRRSADAAGRALARERTLLARRRRERADTLLRLEARMGRAYAERLQRSRARFASLAQLLDAVSYREVLARGFALVRDAEANPLRRRAEVRELQRLRIEFADGEVAAVAGERVGAARTPLTPAPRRRRSDNSFEGQGSLF
jgi:exodeoxyribonuclease VII large subunit